MSEEFIGEQEELELKLSMRPESVDTLQAYLATKGVILQPRTLNDTYFDTPNRIVQRAGFGLRIRNADGRMVQTIKQSVDAAGLYARGEWSTTIRSSTPDDTSLASTPLATILRSKSTEALGPIFRLSVKRSAGILRLSEATGIEVAIDEATISAAEKTLAFVELELEALGATRSDLFDLAIALASAAPLWPSSRSKAARGYVLADLSAGRDQVDTVEPADIEETIRRFGTAEDASAWLTASANRSLWLDRLRARLNAPEDSATFRALETAITAGRREDAALRSGLAAVTMLRATQLANERSQHRKGETNHECS